MLKVQARIKATSRLPQLLQLKHLAPYLTVISHSISHGQASIYYTGILSGKYSPFEMVRPVRSFTSANTTSYSIVTEHSWIHQQDVVNITQLCFHNTVFLVLLAGATPGGWHRRSHHTLTSHCIPRGTSWTPWMHQTLQGGWRLYDPIPGGFIRDPFPCADVMASTLFTTQLL